MWPSSKATTSSGTQTRHAGALQQKEIVTTLIASENAHLEALRAKLETNTGLREKLNADVERLRDQHSGFESEIAALKAEEAANGQKIEALRAYRAAKDEERNDALDEGRDVERRIAQTEVRIAEIRKDIEALDARRASLGARMREIAETVASAQTAIGRLTAEIGALRRAGEENREETVKMMARLEIVTGERGDAEVGTAEYEQKLQEVRLKTREKNNQKELILAAHNKNEIRLRSLTAEADKQSERMYEEYELTFAAALELGYPPLAESECAATRSAAADYRRQMKSIGPVNLGSIEEYKQVRARYDEMSAQIADLTKSKAELTTVINRLENEMRGQFVDAFNRINDNFAKVFVELFGGGTAELVLTEPEDVLNSGIEIKAAPPGKIIKSLTLLSGGEQAFVAIALFFAILKVNPSPFCILDEIEAALDEVNVSRFADYVKRMSDETQFVLITHRRGTMEAADRIYGVTMPERCISKVLALNVKDMELNV